MNLGVFILRANVERVHHYQRGRAAITGLGLWSGKCIETERLVVVVTARLVVLLVYDSGGCWLSRKARILRRVSSARSVGSPAIQRQVSPADLDLVKV
jgi:hypothetical protein